MFVNIAGKKKPAKIDKKPHRARPFLSRANMYNFFHRNYSKRQNNFITSITP